MRAAVASVVALTAGLGASMEPAHAGPGTNLLRVEATVPFIVAGERSRTTFRVAFRIYANSTEELPVTTIRHSADSYGGVDAILGWSAISMAGTTCQLKEGKLRGIGAFGRYSNPRNSIPELDTMYDVTPWVAQPDAAMLVTADFECDGELRAGEVFTIQTRYYVRQRGRWYPADFSYEDQTLAAAR